LNRKWFSVRSAAVFLAPILGIFLILISLEPALNTDRYHHWQTEFYRSDDMKSALSNISYSLSYNLNEDKGSIGIHNTLSLNTPNAYYFKSSGKDLYIQTNTGERNLSTLYANREQYAADNYLVIWYDSGEIQITLGSVDVTSELENSFLNAFRYPLEEEGIDPLSIEFMLAVGDSIGSAESITASPLLETYYHNWLYNRYLSRLFIAALILGAVLIAVGIIFRKYRKDAVEWLLKVLHWIPLEIKLCFAFLLWCVMLKTLSMSSFWVGQTYLPLPDGETAINFLCVVGGWYLLLDFIRTPKLAYVQNSITWKLICVVRRLIQRLIVRTPLERRHLTRFRLFIAAEAVTVPLTAFFLLLFLAGNIYGMLRVLFLFLSVLGFAAIVFFIIRYALLLKTDCEDLHRLSRLTASLRQNTLAPIEPFGETHDFYPLADNLIHLQEGLADAVEARVKSERMKTELVTNVSHDLKTPLTSILSYSRLLDEQNLPEPAGGYVKIICRKAERLQKLTGDLFEVSKAQSGNLPVQLVRLDLNAHLEQTLAELSEQIEKSGLAFRIKRPENAVWIDADGQKLYRVLENLIVNILNYALPATRVWIALTAQDGQAEISLRNISAEEINFTAEQITERFVRGDAARTQDESTPSGSGLGLSIAKSFTEAIGGTFSLSIDGDIFSVFLRFPVQDMPKS